MNNSTTVYDFTIKTLQGVEVSFADHKGKVLLLVNTASHCGFTPQYTGLEELYTKYQSKGLMIVGFPCNQFGEQEPGDAKDIEQNCLVNYGVTFPVTEKIEVNGPNSHPLYVFLKSSLPGVLGTEDIKWNFTKFLLDKQGKPFKRYSSATEPARLEQDIIALLNA